MVTKQNIKNAEIPYSKRNITSEQTQKHLFFRSAFVSNITYKLIDRSNLQTKNN